MIINNGIINIGDDNKNTVYNDIDYNQMLDELNILLKYTDDKNTIEEAIVCVQNKDDKKISKCLKKFSKLTIELVKRLSLVVIQKYLEKYINL